MVRGEKKGALGMNGLARSSFLIPSDLTYLSIYLKLCEKGLPLIDNAWKHTCSFSPPHSHEVAE